MDAGGAYERIEALIRENPSSLDISRLSADELPYVQAALSNIARGHVSRISSSNPLDGLDMYRVFEISVVKPC